HLINLVVVDLREHNVLLDAHGEVATAIEGLRVQTTEVAYAGQRDVHEAIQKFVHAGAAQGDLRADRHAFTDLEARDGVTGARDDRLLAGDRCEVGSCNGGLLGVRRGFAYAHVDDDLVETRDLHLVGEGELLLKRLADTLD